MSGYTGMAALPVRGVRADPVPGPLAFAPLVTSGCEWARVNFPGTIDVCCKVPCEELARVAAECGKFWPAEESAPPVIRAVASSARVILVPIRETIKRFDTQEHII